MTRHTEYHLRDDECVGVRDRGSKLWLLDHSALRLRALKVPDAAAADRWIGRRLQFWGKHTDVLTSPIEQIGRPERIDVGAYCSQAKSGDLAHQATGELQVSLPAQA